MSSVAPTSVGTDGGLQSAETAVQRRLLADLDPAGYWEGELSSSALATSVAVCALAAVDPVGNRELIQRGLTWLTTHANADGGWGDTPDSPSHLPTTLLAWAAANTAPASLPCDRAEAWIARATGSLRPDDIARAVATTYGDDLTFTAPLLALLALNGRLGPEPACWRLVAQLPFELIAVPRRVWPWLRLGVVSYGLPALITIGLVRHRRGGRSWSRGWLRDALTPRALSLLERMWPQGGPDHGRLSGGYNEAPPLIGFVAIGLAGAGLAAHPVAQRCVRYLADWVRPDGSWSVEAHLRTWCTSLAVAAADGLDAGRRDAIRAWLLDCQRRSADPTTGAAPGGWAWNDLPGSMPDGDDTSGALLALHRLAPDDPQVRAAATAGTAWLSGIQNADGGIPTFCRGWGRLPFDRSCPDLTAHALRAWTAWLPVLPHLATAAARAEAYLLRVQRRDGSWIPLWFGNQAAPGQENPTYGTAQVVLALGVRQPSEALTRGLAWLAQAQGADGGWGGDAGIAPSIEETALATAALAGSAHHAAAERGAAWLVGRTRGGTDFPAAPIGLYFAQLWYSQRFYPLVWTALALGRVRAARRTNEK